MILNGWKEISNYLKVHEQTVVDWYKTEGLPVAKVKGCMITSTEILEVWIIKRLPVKKEKAGE